MRATRGSVRYARRWEACVYNVHLARPVDDICIYASLLLPLVSSATAGTRMKFTPEVLVNVTSTSLLTSTLEVLFLRTGMYMTGAEGCTIVSVPLCCYFFGWLRVDGGPIVVFAAAALLCFWPFIWMHSCECIGAAASHVVFYFLRRVFASVTLPFTSYYSSTISHAARFDCVRWIQIRGHGAECCRRAAVWSASVLRRE